VDAVAFEQDGQGGTKRVGFTGGKVEEADDATYARLWAGKGESQKGAVPAGVGKAGRPEGAPTGPQN
jgi:hypothetical protein